MNKHLMTQSEYAAYRGLTRQAVSAAKQAGRLVMSGGYVDVLATDQIYRGAARTAAQRREWAMTHARIVIRVDAAIEEQFLRWLRSSPFPFTETREHRAAPAPAVSAPVDEPAPVAAPRQSDREPSPALISRHRVAEAILRRMLTAPRRLWAKEDLERALRSYHLNGNSAAAAMTHLCRAGVAERLRKGLFRLNPANQSDTLETLLAFYAAARREADNERADSNE
jgi:hypothetical protein